MNTYKRFKGFDFFTQLEAAFMLFVANRTSIRNRAGYRASDFFDLVVSTNQDRKYGCNSSIVTVTNNTLRDFVVRGLATRYRETGTRDGELEQTTTQGRPFIYVFSWAVVKAVSNKLKSIENFGLTAQDQSILLLTNRHKEFFKPFTFEEVKADIPQAKTVLAMQDYFSKSERTVDDQIITEYEPTELAYIYYNRWAEIVQIYSADA